MSEEVSLSNQNSTIGGGGNIKTPSITTVSLVVQQILNNNSVPVKKPSESISNSRKDSVTNSENFEERERSLANEGEEDDSFDTEIRYPVQKPVVLNRTMSTLDADLLERQKLCSLEERRNSKEPLRDGFITHIDKDEDGMVNSIADFVSADIITKPFNFVSGNVRKARFNPFRKKSGLLNVLARQATRNRIVSKNGNINTIFTSEGKAHHFMKDFFISTLELSWTWTFFMFAFVFFFSWLMFASVWYLTFLIHGDFLPENKSNKSFTPCVSAIEDFTSCFLFSLETQHTIGYGGRATTEQCSVAIIVMSLQSILGVIIQACMAGIIFAKFTVPTARQETIVFSKNAVITLRNGHLFFFFGV
ncbi:KCNJN [Lepeophtheirus salmonis]|uniref:KCNJN n=1 Tax=Lepeophtheirus salmonis TaxID=72036 RepID=A0A7R8CJ17_LEPSM|nr:KCNJN [Lepeophtheirus salmonis]CAF2833940.1 KCNJN [Lepeophtheirus salmonis]